MGDRTTVTLMVLNEHVEAAHDIFESNLDPDYSSEGDQFTDIVFHEVNYGVLPFLAKLQQAGIPYDSNWDNGVEYMAGMATCRYDSNGELHETEVSADCANPDLEKLMSLIDDPVSLRSFILFHHDCVTPLPWDDQLENSKLYRTKKLIST